MISCLCRNFKLKNKINIRLMSMKILIVRAVPTKNTTENDRGTYPLEENSHENVA